MTLPSSTGDGKAVVSEKFRFLAPGVGYREFVPEFTMRDIVESLTLSTYTRPRAVTVNLGNGDEGLHVQVVVESLAALYVRHELPGSGGQTLGCFEHPEWGVTGRVLRELFSPADEVTTVRIYLEIDADDPQKLELGLIQSSQPLDEL